MEYKVVSKLILRIENKNRFFFGGRGKCFVFCYVFYTIHNAKRNHILCRQIYIFPGCVAAIVHPYFDVIHSDILASIILYNDRFNVQYFGIYGTARLTNCRLTPARQIDEKSKRSERERRGETTSGSEKREQKAVCLRSTL